MPRSTWRCPSDWSHSWSRPSPARAAYIRHPRPTFGTSRVGSRAPHISRTAATRIIYAPPCSRYIATFKTAVANMSTTTTANGANGTNGHVAPTANGSALDTVKDAIPKPFSDQRFATSNWASPGKSEYNFFSDTATSGTLPMLQSIVATTLQDDVFSEDTTTNSLEEWVASLFGKEAGLLVLSGTMGNQLALRAHLNNPPHSVVADERSHIYESEAGGVASLSQAMCYGVRPSGDRAYITLEDIIPRCILDDNFHHCPTRVVSLENTLNGCVMPLSECQRISEWCRSHGIALHCDGARIWEAVAGQVAAGEHGGDLAAGLRAYGDCFDTLQACFSKGLGAPVGSIVVGDAKTIKKARHHRKAIGGGLRATGIIAAPARVAVEETFLKGRLVATHALAKRVAKHWQGKGGKLLNPVETNMVWIDVQGSGIDMDHWMKATEDQGIRVGWGRLVFHYQISEDAIQRLLRAMDKVFAAKQA